MTLADALNELFGPRCAVEIQRNAIRNEYEVRVSAVIADKDVTEFLERCAPSKAG